MEVAAPKPRSVTGPERISRAWEVAEAVVEELGNLEDCAESSPVVTKGTRAKAKAEFASDLRARLLAHQIGDGAYSVETARTSRRLSALSYEKPEKIRAEARKMGLDQVRIIEDRATGTQGFVASDGKRAFVVFRGTEDVRDLTTCLKGKKVAGHGGMVHGGFKGSADAVDDQVRKALAEIGDGKPTFVCGHSLGGAVAELTALELDKRGHDIVGVYAFGAPRVGDEAFAAEYDRRLGCKTHLHVRPGDPVPCVPFQMFGFHDVAGGRGRTCHGKCTDISPGPTAEFRLFREIAGKVRGAGRDLDKLKAALAPYLQQHSIAGYVIGPPR